MGGDGEQIGAALEGIPGIPMWRKMDGSILWGGVARRRMWRKDLVKLPICRVGGCLSTIGGVYVVDTGCCGG